MSSGTQAPPPHRLRSVSRETEMKTEEAAKKTLVVIGVSRETIEQLEAYVKLLRLWNRTTNLVGAGSLNEVWARHVLDSAQLWDLVDLEEGPLFDLGSGAGFPGMVLAILGCRRVTLIESNKKKCLFLTHVSRTLGLSVSVVNSRVEGYKPEQRAKFVTSRALASVKTLIRYSQPLVSKDGKCFFWKGKNSDQELTEAKNSWSMEIEKFSSITSVEGKILAISKLGFHNEGF